MSPGHCCCDGCPKPSEECCGGTALARPSPGRRPWGSDDIGRATTVRGRCCRDADLDTAGVIRRVCRAMASESITVSVECLALQSASLEAPKPSLLRTSTTTCHVHGENSRQLINSLLPSVGGRRSEMEQQRRVFGSQPIARACHGRGRCGVFSASRKLDLDQPRSTWNCSTGHGTRALHSLAMADRAQFPSVSWLTGFVGVGIAANRESALLLRDVTTELPAETQRAPECRRSGFCEVVGMNCYSAWSHDKSPFPVSHQRGRNPLALHDLRQQPRLR